MRALALHCDKKTKNAFIFVFSAFYPFNDKNINKHIKMDFWHVSARFTGICARMPIVYAVFCKGKKQTEKARIF